MSLGYERYINKVIIIIIIIIIRAELSLSSPNANPWGREVISLDLTLC